METAMKKSVLIVVAGVFIWGCAVPVPEAPPSNPRVIERDLTRPWPPVPHDPAPPVSPAPVEPAAQPLNESPADLESAWKPKATFCIEFANESLKTVTQESADSYREIMDLYQSGDTLLLIGHSHGPSRVGNARLATGRAQTVQEALVAQGVDPARIRTLAAWSAVKGQASIGRGVEILLIGEEAPMKEACLLLAKI
jgi:hypothetical protein